jgi:MFS family permease
MEGKNKVLAYLGSRGMGRALRHRDFAIFTLVGWFSSVGLWVQRIAVQWLVWKLTGSFALLGAIAVADVAVTLLVMPFAGTVADRVDRLKLARLAQASAMVVAGTIAALVFVDAINIHLLFALMMANGGVVAFWTPMRYTITPNLVPRDDLSAALGVGSMLFNLAQFVGPAVAGLLISQWGLGYAFAFNCLSYTGLFIALNLITLNAQEHRKKEKAGFLADIKEGIAYIRTRPGIGTLMTWFFFSSLCMRAYLDLLPRFADGVFAEGAGGVATLGMFSGLGAVAAGIFVANFVALKGLTRLILTGMIAGIAFQALYALAPSFEIGLFAITGMGVCLLIMGTGSMVLMQSTLHGEVRGRVMSLWGLIFRGGPALGALIIGSAAELWGFRAPMLGATLLFFCVWAVIMPRRRALAAALERPPEERAG